MVGPSRRFENYAGNGTSRSGIGAAANKRRHGFASHRAQLLARLRLALSVAIPVLAYIWRYNLDMKMNANRARNVGVQLDRFQMEAKL
jgi:hypothetical protein